MKVLITGGSGFLGRYLLSEAKSLNCSVATVGRTPVDSDQHFTLDLSADTVDINWDPELVIHAAGKAHVVPRSEAEVEAFHKTNVIGTRNLLDGLQGKENLRQFVFISSVAVYGVISGEGISEMQPIDRDALTPYGKSKWDCEEMITEWCEARNISYQCYRLPLVVGDSPKGNLESMIRAIQKGYYFRIKGNTARKSMVWGKDVAVQSFKPLRTSGVFNLTDGIHPDITSVESALEKLLGKRINKTLPRFPLRVMASIGDAGQSILRRSLPFSGERLKKLTSSLTFSDEKAREEIGWTPHACLEIISHLKY